MLASRDSVLPQKPSTIVPRNAFFPIGDIKPLDIDYLRDIIIDDDPPKKSFNEIIPNLFIGDEFIATNVKMLKALSITHIVNASLGHCSFSHVDTNEIYYARSNYYCKFMGIPASDITSFQLSHYFGFVSQFIEDGLRVVNNGKVLVHSLHGISRSATLVVAYLMIYRKKSAINALKLVRKKRNIDPNDGFLQQLCDLDFVLKLRAKNKPDDKKDPMDPTKELQKGTSNVSVSGGISMQSNAISDNNAGVTTNGIVSSNKTSSNVESSRNIKSESGKVDDEDNDNDTEDVDKTPPKILMEATVPKKSNLFVGKRKDKINENGVRPTTPTSRRVKFAFDTKKFDGGQGPMDKEKKVKKPFLHAKPSVCKVHGVKHKCAIHPDRKRRSD